MCIEFWLNTEWEWSINANMAKMVILVKNQIKADVPEKLEV